MSERPESKPSVPLAVGWAWWLSRWGVLMTYALVKFSAYASSRPLYAGDDGVWLSVGRHDLDATKFWFAHRPFFVPLIHKLSGLDETMVVWVQGCLAVLSWSSLAWMLSSMPRSLLARGLCLIAPLAVSLLHPVHGWDFTIRSESASMSLTALLLALTIGLLKSPRGGRTRWLWAASMLVVCVPLVFTRDTNFIFALGLGLWLLLVDTWFSPARRVCRSSTALTGAFVVVAVLGHLNAREAGRHMGPMMNVIFQRVLNHSDRLEFFANDLGMPVNSALMKRKGKWHSQDDHAAFKDEGLREFRRWLKHDGLSEYRRYVLGHLGELSATTLRVYPVLMNDRFPRYAKAAPNVTSSVVSRLWFKTSPFVRWPRASLGLGAVLSVALVFAKSRRARRIAALAVFLFGAAWCMLFAGYVGDAMEVIRHSVTAVPLLALAGIGCAAALVEWAWPRVRRHCRRRFEGWGSGRLTGAFAASTRRLAGWAPLGVVLARPQLARPGVVVASIAIWVGLCALGLRRSPHQQWARTAEIHVSSTGRGSPELIRDGDTGARFCTEKERDAFITLDLGARRKLRRLVLFGLKPRSEVGFSKDGERFERGLVVERGSARLYHLDRVRPAQRARFVRLTPEPGGKERRGKKSKRKPLCVTDVRVY